VLTQFEIDYLEPNIGWNDTSWGITLYIYAIGLELVENYESEGSDPGNDYPIHFIPLTWWELVLFVLAILIGVPVIFGGGRGGFGGGRTGGGGSRGRL
jgi:hypothetical protein